MSITSPLGELQRTIETGRLTAHLFNLQLSLQAKKQLLDQLEQLQQQVAQQLVPHDMAIAQSLLEAKDQLCKLEGDGVLPEQIAFLLGGGPVTAAAVEMVRAASFDDIVQKMSSGFQIAAGTRKI